MLALYKAGCGLYRPVDVLEIDLVASVIYFRFVRGCNVFKYASFDRIIAYDELLVGTNWL